MAAGEVVPRRAILAGPNVVARVELLEPLGLRAVDHPMGVGGHVPADPTGRTTVPGAWVAGNVTDVAGQVMAAAAAGTMAGGAVNADLVTEDVQVAVAARATTRVPA